MTSAGAASAPRLPIDLLVVVVNYRTPGITINCLESLAPNRSPGIRCRVVVVDNASGDESADQLAQAIGSRGWASWATLCCTSRNGGFSFGNNRGIEAGLQAFLPRFVLLLNSDTIVQPGCLRSCIDRMDSDPSIGLFSCKLLNADGSVQNVVRRFPSPLRVFISTTGLPWLFPRLFGWADTNDPGWDRATTARDVDWIGGAFLMIRTEVLDRIGVLDEDFFFYGEDTEYSHRAARAGIRRYYDPVGSVVHLGGASSDPALLPTKSRNIHAWRGRYLVQRKCYGRPAEWFVRCVDIAGCAVRLAWHRVSPMGKPERFAELSDMLKLLVRPLGTAT